MGIRFTSRTAFIADCVNLIIETYCVVLSCIIWCIPVCIIKWLIANVLPASGIEFNGTNPWDPQILDGRFYSTLAWGGFGFYKSMKKNWIQIYDFTGFIERFTVSPLFKRYAQCVYPFKFLHRWFDLQSPDVASDNILSDYEFGSDLFSTLMGSNIQFSTCCWKNASTMEEAAIEKMNLIGRKLKLEPGMTVLDIGCGWGTLAKHLAENFGVNVTGVTLSNDGSNYAQNICIGLPAKFFCLDYRFLNPKEKFDRIVSIEMFEHVGPAQHRNYFATVARYLKDDGLFLFQASYTPHSYVPQCDMADRLMYKNIWFPYINEIWRASERLFIPVDFQTLNGYTDKTYSGILTNLEKNKDSIISQFDEEFHFKLCFIGKMWLGCFKAKTFDVCQIVFSKAARSSPYHSER